MQTRTLYALLAATLVLASGAALAQASDPAPAEPASTPAPAADPATSPEPTRFALHVRPNALWLTPGASARVHVVLEGQPFATYALHLRLMDGLEPVIGDARAVADENGRAEATLALAADDSPTKRAYGARVLATSEDGVERVEALRVHVKPRDRPVEPTKPEPAKAEPAKAEPARPVAKPEPAHPEPIRGEPAKPARAHPAEFVVVDPYEAFHPQPTGERAEMLKILAILERIEARLARYEATCMVVPIAPVAQGAAAEAVEPTA